VLETDGDALQGKVSEAGWMNEGTNVVFRQEAVASPWKAVYLWKNEVRGYVSTC
jgi:hypothetical protein